jgi:long-chain fatty acid transport protein
MKTKFLKVLILLFSVALYAQSGHIMQGVGAVNMSMGGAVTGQPLDISGALHWNPAAVSTFDETIFKLDIGLFFSSPELSSPDGPWDATTNPLGVVPGSEVSFDMTTSMIMVGLTYTFDKKE